MKKVLPSVGSAGGFTLIELMITVMILTILITILIASYDTLMAKARFSKVKADMNGIAYAGNMVYANHAGDWNIQGDWPVADDPAHPLDPPSSLIKTAGYTRWPAPPCPGYYYTWDNGIIFGLNIVRVTLRRKSDEGAVWSFCVNTSCDAADIYGFGTPIEISTSLVSHMYCNE